MKCSLSCAFLILLFGCASTKTTEPSANSSKEELTRGYYNDAVMAEGVGDLADARAGYQKCFDTAPADAAVEASRDFRAFCRKALLRYGNPVLPAAGDVQRAAQEAAVHTIPVGTVDVEEFDFVVNPVPLIGNKSILDVNPGTGGRQFKIIPLKKGTSSLVVTDSAGTKARSFVFNVVTNDLFARVNAIRKLLQGIDGISVEAYDDKIVIDGQILEPKQMDRILGVAGAYGADVLNLVKLDPRLYSYRAHRMEDEIAKDEALAHVKVIFLNDTYLLVGRVERNADRDRAEAIVQLLLPEIMARQSIRESLLVLGSRKYSIRNLIEVTGK